MDVIRYLLGPVLLYQGRRTRKAVPRLVAPEYARVGTQGTGNPLNILIVGDSSGEGVGAPKFEQTLLGHLLQQMPYRQIHWQVAAKSGLTTEDAIKEVSKIKPKSLDLAITALGINDITSSMKLKAWLKQQHSLHQLLIDHWKVNKIIVSGIPPVRGFPALPQPLRWYLGRRALVFDKSLQKYIQRKAKLEYLSLEFCQDFSLMATDGFHPGPEIYRQWAQEVIKRIHTII